MKSVFLIKTPLQLLNAIEAKNYFNLSRDDCVLIIMGDRKSLPQILMLVGATDEWGKVLSLNNVDLFFENPFEGIKSNFPGKIQGFKIFKRSFFYVRRLNKISRFLGKVKYIFIGYTRYVYMSHFVNITQHEKLVFLDDGNGSFELAKKRKNGTVLTSGYSFKKRLKLYGKIFFQRVKTKESKQACFFTAYDVVPGENDNVIKNNFRYLRSNVCLHGTTEDVYFIGSPLSEVGIVKLQDYLNGLSKVKKYFSGKKITYIAHRRDSAEKLEIIEKKLNFNVVLFDYPIEHQLAFIGPRPAILASFFSAALDSCRLIFGDNLKIISFKLDVSSSPQCEEIEGIYESYSSHVNEYFNVVTDY